MGRPRVTLSRKGRISSGRVGPPKAISRTASAGITHAPRADSSCTASTSARTWSTGVSGRTPCPRLKMCPGRPRGLRRGSRRRAAGSPGSARAARPGRGCPARRRRARARAQAGVEIDAPVEADDVAARVAHALEQPGGAGAEVDHRHARRERRDQRPHVRQDVRAVVGRARGSRPSCRRAARACAPAAICAFR